MKVCAEYEDQIAAFTAHRALLDKGVDPENIEIRSPYPLSEHPIPPHRSKPMIVRNVARVFWLCGILGGFSFLTFTQWEWGLTAKTGGHPLVAIPINAIPMYECGMISAILMTTLMFFVETRRYRQLVPPIEEDMIVANGYIALIVNGEMAEKAKDWLSGTNARSVVSYMLPLAFMSMFLSGCGGFISTTRWDNHRMQSVIKPGEASADLPAPLSIRMPDQQEQLVAPPQPIGYLYYGDQAGYESAVDDLAGQIEQKVKAGEIPERRKAIEERKLKKEIRDEMAPEIVKYHEAPPTAAYQLSSPVKADERSLADGEKLYNVNCAQCHGAKGLGDGGVGKFWGGPREGTGGAIPQIGNGSVYGDQYKDGFYFVNIFVGKNKMPSFGQKLTTQEIWDIVNYLRQLQGTV